MSVRSLLAFALFTAVLLVAVFAGPASRNTADSGNGDTEVAGDFIEAEDVTETEEPSPEDDASEAESPSREAAPSTAAPTTSSTTTTTLAPKEPVTIAFGGDIHFEKNLAVRLENETLTMLSPVADMMAEADLAVANLETTVTDRGETAPGKAYNFRTTPAAFDALRSSGIDVVSLANNHGVDFGPVGLQDTLDAASEKDFPLIGAGVDADAAYAPYVATINGQSIAVIGATQVLDSNLIPLWTATDTQPGLASAKEVERLVQAVTEARAVHDTVVVYLHWGIEGDTCPAPRQLELSDALVDAGADIIVGGHAHRLQGGGFKEGAFVHYGLGNFVFYKYSGPSIESGVLKITIDGRNIESYEWVPATLSNGVATATENPSALASWNNLRTCTDLSDTPEMLDQ